MNSKLKKDLIALSVGLVTGYLCWLNFNTPINASLILAVLGGVTGLLGTVFIQNGGHRRASPLAILILLQFVLMHLIISDFGLGMISEVSRYFRAYVTLIGLLCYFTAALIFSRDYQSSKQ